MRPTTSTPITALLRSSPLRNNRRALLRTNGQAIRHNATTTASNAASAATSQASAAASKAGQQASEAAKKASEGLVAISQKAGPFLMGVLGTLGKVGGRTGRLVKKVEGMVPRGIYYSKVIAELSKLVFHTRAMAPPPMATFETYYRSLLNNPQLRTLPSLDSIKAKVMDRATLTRGSIVAAELLGFFTVGEMIGKRKIVGYRGKVESAHH